ncbi:glutamine synthetase family protein [Oceanicoccus sagamiensis]|uniref:Glutamine synthetase n=1 Tax=Oceanicoccus sagamiensis TaxID=716816 RepID=A0A1X9N5R8_9GAMM|nr:glutamine synthetase family protein [Oceanicoccus sagamiensis]ARN73076.1 glutamine synthetase [Oceanicoccus sagamiensis]
MSNDFNEARKQALQFLADNPDIEIIEVLFTDLNGALRGKWLPANKLESVFNWGDFKMPLTTTTPDIWGRDVAALCASTGDGDGLCSPIISSLKRLPWTERPTAQLFLQMHGEDGSPWGFDPRVVLKNVVAKYQTLGLRPVTAPELEFHLLLEQRDAMGVPQLPDSRCNGKTKIAGQLYSIDMMQEQAALLHEIREAAQTMELPLDGLLKELGPGQYELNLYHLDDPLQVADNMQLIKRLIKGMAKKHGYIASFMAKPFADQEGNGLHCHTSLLDKNGHNLFDNNDEQGTDVLRHAVAGLAETMAESMLIFAPHLNSYRRFTAGSHISLAPTWGYENRAAALRIPNGNTRARRIEHRVAGADANPYLMLAVILAGIIHGISNQLTAQPPINDNSQPPEPSLPNNWHSALALFQHSDFIKQQLGTDFHRAFCAVKQAEQAEFARAISPFEYDSYLVMA